MKPEEKIERAYEELRAIIDGGSESFTHEDAVQYLKDKLAQPEQDEVDIRSRLYQRIHELETQLAQPEQEMVSYERFIGVEKELADMTAEFMRVAKQVAQPEQEPVSWPTMPPSKDQSPIFFEDGYAEGWAKCMSMCKAAFANIAPPQPNVDADDISSERVDKTDENVHEQNPVADAYALADKVREALDRQSCPDAFMRAAWEAVVNNYTTPPQRDSSATPLTWVGLTDEERNEAIRYGTTLTEIAEDVEAKLKEKNT